jgi:hypothetical protein
MDNICQEDGMLRDEATITPGHAQKITLLEWLPIADTQLHMSIISQACCHAYRS